MHIQDAASSLLREIHAPQGAVSVLPLMDNGGRLVVWLDLHYRTLAAQLPAMYEGFPVKVELRPVALGL